jgi:hypothetical protein
MICGLSLKQCPDNLDILELHLFHCLFSFYSFLGRKHQVMMAYNYLDRVIPSFFLSYPKRIVIKLNK